MSETRTAFAVGAIQWDLEEVGVVAVAVPDSGPLTLAVMPAVPVRI